MTDPALLKRFPQLARQEADKQQVAAAGAATHDYSDAGPPNWNRASWDTFKAQYGRYPFSASELPPSFIGAPAWVYELCGLRVPPVSFRQPSP